jgi:hypothetical protein
MDSMKQIQVVYVGTTRANIGSSAQSKAVEAMVKSAGTSTGDIWVCPLTAPGIKLKGAYN